MYQSNVDVAVTEQLCNPAIPFSFNESASTTVTKSYIKDKVGFELSNDGSSSIGIRLKDDNGVVYDKELKPGEVASKWTLPFNKVVLDNPNDVAFRLDIMG